MGIIMLVNLDDQIENITVTTNIQTSLFDDNSSTLSLSTTPDSLTATTKNNSWLSFDGVNDQLILGENLHFNGENQLTVLSWIKFNASSNTALSRKVIFGPDSYRFGLFMGNGTTGTNNRTCYLVADGITKSKASVCSTSDIEEDKWYHIAGTYNGTTMMFFLNGVLNNSIVNDSLSYTGTPGGIYIGKYISGGYEYNGKIDDLRYYNRSMNAAEILEIYSSGRNANYSLPSDSLRIWLPLNEGVGTDVHTFNESDLT